MRQGGYDPTFFDRLALIEDCHFWFRSRSRLIFDVSSKISRDLPPASRILEVGCGTGNVLKCLELAYPQGTVFGLDFWQEGLQYARRRTSCPLIRADLNLHPFRTPFHVIGIFDVLEHISDDQRALEDLCSMLVPGGTLLITVPAHQWLWSYFDEAARHCRRYSVADLSTKLELAGFRIDFLTQFMACTLPLLAAVRKLPLLMNGGKAADDRQLAGREFRVIPVLNAALTGIANVESWWASRGHRLPWGSSILAVARR